MTDPIKKAYDEGYAAGWAAYGDLMIEQLGPEGMVWRPIETAPDDETKILAFSPGNKGALNQNAKAPQMRVDRRRERYLWRYELEFPESPYTHWMPLPKPPR